MAVRQSNSMKFIWEEISIKIIVNAQLENVPPIKYGGLLNHGINALILNALTLIVNAR